MASVSKFPGFFRLYFDRTDEFRADQLKEEINA